MSFYIKNASKHMTLRYIQLLYENAPNKLMFRLFKHLLVKESAYNPFIQNLKSQKTSRLIHIPSTKKPQKWVEEAFMWMDTPQDFTFWLDINCKWLKIVRFLTISHTT